MSEATAQLQAALRYASAGVAVFPSRLYVRGDGKKGVKPIADWDTASSTDPEVIRGWFTGTWQDAALCIDCGKSGIVGVDQDVTEGKDGRANWAELDPPTTWRVRSPTGGAHDYYRADPAHPFTVDNTGAVADGVDIRGMGGFLFAPPSVDPRGGAWQWVEGEPDWAALPMVPEIVIKRMEGAAAGKRAKAPARLEQDAGARSLRAVAGGSQLFDAESFGPGGGYKTESAARALLTARLEEFLSRTAEGSARSHFLAQDLGVLAGHGVGVFWTYEAALQTLLDAASANGMTAVHGLAYVDGQARRGLDYGMLQPWARLAEPVTAVEVLPEPAMDAVDALLNEMLTADQMQERPAPKPLIKGIYNLDSIAWVIGAPGSKKSFVVLDQAAHVVRGMSWQGLKVTPGPVVIIAAEGAAGMVTRVKAWQQRNGPIGAGLYVLPRPVQAIDPVAWRVLVEACRRLAPVMVVIDTQARVTVGLDENSARDMGVFIESAEAIRRATGACVVPVHHTGRQGGDARGSSAIDGAQGTELKVVRQDAMTGVLKIEKQKDLEERADIPLHFSREVVGIDEDGEEITSLVLLEGSTWLDAQGTDEPPERGQEVLVPEPEPWTVRIYDHNRGENVRRILTIVAHVAGEHGATEADVRRILLSRWYDGRPMKAKRAGHLDPETWVGSWSKTLDLQDGAGNKIIEKNPDAARYWIHPDVLSELG